MRILYNANLLTLDSSQPTASAMAVDAGRIVAVGSDDDVLALDGLGVVKEDLQGKTVWPGLTDAHLHLDHLSTALSVVDCETDTQAECLRRVAERASTTQKDGWVLGHGWNQNVWPEGFGTAGSLEQAASGRPAFLTAKSLHAAWANRSALALAGITRDTPDPEGGIIQRDPHGEPTGILLESAMELVMQVIPEKTIDQTVLGIRAAQQVLWKSGITGVHDFDGRRCFAALQILDAQGELHLRVVKSIPVDLLEHAAALGLRSGFGSSFLRIGSVKLFADGALGPQTAAMLQPYEGDSGNTGVLLLDAEQIFEFGQSAARSGLGLAIHAIGDRANHEVLSAYQQLRSFEEQERLPHLRHRIEHVQVLHPQDKELLSRLDVIASMQPIHATSDMYTADRYWGSRSSLAYAFRTLLDLGTRLAFGSDAPVESPNPFLGLHAAVTRQRPNGEPGPNGWYPEQRLELMDALKAYTTGPAYAAGLESSLAKLAPGFAADCIVLPIDPFEIPPQEFHSITPLATMVAGEWVWRN